MCNSCLLLKESHEPGVLPDLVCGWGVLVGALSVAEGVCVGVVSGVWGWSGDDSAGASSMTGFFKSIDRNCLLLPVNVQYEIFGVPPEYLVRTRIWWSKTCWYSIVAHKYTSPLVDVQRDMCFYSLWTWMCV